MRCARWTQYATDEMCAWVRVLSRLIYIAIWHISSEDSCSEEQAIDRSREHGDKGVLEVEHHAYLILRLAV